MPQSALGKCGTDVRDESKWVGNLTREAVLLCVGCVLGKSNMVSAGCCQLEEIFCKMGSILEEWPRWKGLQTRKNRHLRTRNTKRGWNT